MLGNSKKEILHLDKLLLGKYQMCKSRCKKVCRLTGMGHMQACNCWQERPGL